MGKKNPKNTKKHPKTGVFSCFFAMVEVVGIEPTSYSAAKKLSTYLVGLLFLFPQRGQTRFAVRRQLNTL